MKVDMMGRFARHLAVVVLAFGVMSPAMARDTTLLHSFMDKPDGRTPRGSPTLSGSTLYGMTAAGGTAGRGVVYRIQTDGSDYRILRTFAGGVTDGSFPDNTSLTVDGAMLYGVTGRGGVADQGTLFKMTTDGTNFQLLYSFEDRSIVKSGTAPQGNLVLSGSTLYGTTSFGGWGREGTIFKIRTDGSGFKVLYAFGGKPTGGQTLNGGIALDGSTLYGMTRTGGTHDCGTVYKIGTNGKGFALLHSFQGGIGGDTPHGGPVVDGTTLYGVTSNWKTDHCGTVFKMRTDGSGFTIIHVFCSGAADGQSPYGSVTLHNSVLYGMTLNGGAGKGGTIFQIGTDGSGFELLHSFTSGNRDGGGPFGNLVHYGTNLYGMTGGGGAAGQGTVFSLDLAATPMPAPPEASATNMRSLLLPLSLVALGIAGIAVVVLCYLWRGRALRKEDLILECRDPAGKVGADNLG